MRIINGKILTMEEESFEQGYIEFNNGKIISLGDMKEIIPEKEDIDAKGGYVLPGFIDAHTCLGLKEESNRYEGVDWNETSSPITPQMNALDGFNPLDGAVSYALNGGVTTVVAVQGNSNLIGGQATAIKLAGRNPWKMVIKNPCAIKISLGEEPKLAYAGKGKAPITRMAEVAMLREALNKAKAYMESGAAYIDYESLALIPLLKGEIPAYIHALRGDDILTALRLSEEFNFKCIIVHGAESPYLAEQIKKAGASVIIGSLVLTNYSYETRNLSLQVPRELYKKGVPFCITTDHHMSPIEYLSVSAALAVREGLPMDVALRSITIEPANIAGISDRVGSLAVGKDADIAVFTKHPFKYDARLAALFINGEKVR